LVEQLQRRHPALLAAGLEPHDDPKGLLLELRQRHAPQLEARLELDLGRVCCGAVEVKSARVGVDHGERAFVGRVHRALHDEHDRQRSGGTRQQFDAARLELANPTEDLGQVHPLLARVRERVRHLVRKLGRVLECCARRVESSTSSVRQAAALVLQVLQREAQHFERDVHVAIFERRAAHKRVGELGRKGWVQPDRWRLGIQAGEAELLRTSSLSLSNECSVVILATEGMDLGSDTVLQAGRASGEVGSAPALAGLLVSLGFGSLGLAGRACDQHSGTSCT
jgi:hypothetical protein